MSIYEDVVELGKLKLGMKSDRAFALKIGLSPQLICDLKYNRSKANALSYLKLINSAGLSLEDGITILERHKSNSD